MTADLILVFSNGRIVEEEKYHALLDKNGLYADLVNFQLQ
jgi:ABC-type transport system involved in Fe-S cluster assembly fused permease/ATPase subunit